MIVIGIVGLVWLVAVTVGWLADRPVASPRVRHHKQEWRRLGHRIRGKKHRKWRWRKHVVDRARGLK